jgi:small-conductance mechanosensitive channel
MSSSLIRQDLVPIVSGYVILMTALGVGLWLSRRPPRAGRSSRLGWPRLLRHLAGTAVGGYVLLMAIVVLYYYLVARVAGSFLDSAVTGCATLAGLSLPVFAGASWLAERRSGRRARARASGDDQAPAGGRQRRD